MRIGNPSKGEYYLTWSDPLVIAVGEFTYNAGQMPTPVAIVARKAKWQKMLPSQWKNKPVEARVRNHADSPWEYLTVVFYRPGTMKWKTTDGRWFAHAEVRGKDEQV